MIVVTIIITLVSILLIAATLVSMVRLDYWQVRMFDFPRLQISILLIMMLGVSYFVYDFNKIWPYAVIGLMVFSLVYQLTRIYNYTFFAPKQVKRFHGSDPDHSISILVSNVLKTNKESDKLLRLVDKYNPDMVLTLESNSWWEEQLRPLEGTFKYTVKKPMENLYGMHLYSKLKLSETDVKFRVKDDIPSIDGFVHLRSGKRVRIYCLHPMPPSPTESPTSTSRDGELLMVAKELDTVTHPVLIAGDLNDVAWSKTTSLFQKISGLLDPRIGRGFFNTFHANYPFLRWPLDHIFHSDDFKLNEISRLDSIGSDHFPIYANLQYTPAGSGEQEEPEADRDEEELADEKVAKAKKEN